MKLESLIRTQVVGHKSGLRTVALFEAVKGMLVLIIGLGLLSFVHHDVQQKAEELVRHFHLNPANRYPRIFLQLAQKITDVRLVLFSLAALFYSSFRFAEAYGLWHARRWAQWLGVVSGAVYIPIEAFELCERFSRTKATVLLVNLAIVGYLIYTIMSKAGDT
jgi:uncharacterized membrane protein (DUF2068 family)